MLIWEQSTPIIKYTVTEVEPLNFINEITQTEPFSIFYFTIVDRYLQGFLQYCGKAHDPHGKQ